MNFERQVFQNYLYLHLKTLECTPITLVFQYTLVSWLGTEKLGKFSLSKMTEYLHSIWVSKIREVSPLLSIVEVQDHEYSKVVTTLYF